MGGAGARSRDANTQTPGKLGISRCHKRSHLLVPGLDELDFSIGTIEGTKHAVNAVAGITEDMTYTPVMETLDEKITYSLGHGQLQLSTRRSANKREAGGVPIVPSRAAGAASARSQRAESASKTQWRVPNGRGTIGSIIDWF